MSDYEAPSGSHSPEDEQIYKVRPKDKHVTALYKEYGLAEAALVDELEPIALALLESAETMLKGASLVLGTRIGGDSPDKINALFFDTHITPQERFDDLLFVRRLIDSGTDPVDAAKMVKNLRIATQGLKKIKE